MKAPGDGPRYPIESVDNALTLLVMLREREAFTLSEAADLLQVAPSTAHRLLAMLEHRGFVQRDPVTRTYLAGPMLIEIGLAALRDGDIRQHTRPYVTSLVDELGETAHLVVLRGGNLLYLDCVESPRAIRAGSRVGEMLPAYATAGGKALLAALAPQLVSELYSGSALAPLTPHTIKTVPRLLKELERVREAGYAVNNGESEPNLRAVAAAIVDRAGVVRAAITVAAPEFRLPTSAVPRVAVAVSRAATVAGENLG